jgi:hypothetical protein
MLICVSGSGTTVCLSGTVGAWLSLARAPGSGPGGRWFKSTRPDHYFPSRFNMLGCVFYLNGSFIFTDNTDNIARFGPEFKTQAHVLCLF